MFPRAISSTYPLNLSSQPIPPPFPWTYSLHHFLKLSFHPFPKFIPSIYSLADSSADSLDLFHPTYPLNHFPNLFTHPGYHLDAHPLLYSYLLSLLSNLCGSGTKGTVYATYPFIYCLDQFPQPILSANSFDLFPPPFPSIYPPNLSPHLNLFSRPIHTTFTLTLFL